MRLFTRVGSDVSRLVLETVEGLVAEGTLVWPGELGRILCGLTPG